MPLFKNGVPRKPLILNRFLEFLVSACFENAGKIGIRKWTGEVESFAGPSRNYAGPHPQGMDHVDTAPEPI